MTFLGLEWWAWVAIIASVAVIEFGAAMLLGMIIATMEGKRDRRKHRGR